MPTAPRRSTRMVSYVFSAMSLSSTLFFRTKKRRAARLGDAAHAFGASAAGAGLALLAVDRPAMLEIAELAIGLDIVAQRRSPGLDRLAQHRFDRGGELVGARTGNGPGKAAAAQTVAAKPIACA